MTPIVKRQNDTQSVRVVAVLFYRVQNKAKDAQPSNLTVVAAPCLFLVLNHVNVADAGFLTVKMDSVLPMIVLEYFNALVRTNAGHHKYVISAIALQDKIVRAIVNVT